MQKEPWIVEILRFVVPFSRVVYTVRNLRIWHRMTIFCFYLHFIHFIEA